ncbi:MAG: hypothetical protein OXG60_17360 [Chloroflexi bacterium]|nr:hypothetical protein [Chloroflexota bacterium]
MSLPRNPKFRLFVRLITYIALKSFALGIADSLIQQRTLDHSLYVAQGLTLMGMLTFGIAIAVVGVVIAAVFGYEPDPRCFKLTMALALVALPALVIVIFVQDWLRYPNRYDIYFLLLFLAHAAISLWISQIAARKYLAEQYASLQHGKT